MSATDHAVPNVAAKDLISMLPTVMTTSSHVKQRDGAAAEPGRRIGLNHGLHQRVRACVGEADDPPSASSEIRNQGEAAKQPR